MDAQLVLKNFKDALGVADLNTFPKELVLKAATYLSTLPPEEAKFICKETAGLMTAANAWLNDFAKDIDESYDRIDSIYQKQLDFIKSQSDGLIVRLSSPKITEDEALVIYEKLKQLNDQYTEISNQQKIKENERQEKKRNRKFGIIAAFSVLAITIGKIIVELNASNQAQIEQKNEDEEEKPNSD